MEYLFPLSGNFSVQSQCDTEEDRLIFFFLLLLFCSFFPAKFQHGIDESTGVQL